MKSVYKLKRLKKILLYIFSFLIIVIFSCFNQRVFNNSFYRYKIRYPENWIVVKPGELSRKSGDFKYPLDKYNLFPDYNKMDITFYNPKSLPPLLETIAVKSEQSRYSFNELNEKMSFISDLILTEVKNKFNDATLLNYYKKELSAGFSFWYIYEFANQGKKYYFYYIILPGKLFATHYIMGICETNRLETFYDILNTTVLSFRKY